MKQFMKNKAVRATVYVLSLFVMIYVLVYMPTPYLIYGPGSADEIKPMVTVKDGDKTERGTFMLTTVSASYANVVMLGLSKLDSNSEIQRKVDRLRGRSEDEYSAEQVWYMDHSQSESMEAAYHKAGISYRIVPNYVYVFKAASTVGPLKPGDEIVAVNDRKVADNDTIRSILGGLHAGDTVNVTVKRSGEMKVAKVKLSTITDSETGKKRPGFGVSIATVQKVVPDDPQKTITFAATDIGGPSAGLMFSMEIYNQLTPGDLSKGYRVAGTGTMDKDGNVGAIGGVVHKIVAADRKHADIFFVPADNYKDAKTKAGQLGSTMKLVSVRTLDDALDYMSKLPVKP